MSGINQEQLDFMEKARLIFSRTKYCQGNSESDKKLLAEEIQKLAQNMLLLEKNNLNKLNKRLINSGRKVWDFLTEHLFAVELISHNPDTQIEYEPDYFAKPVDFVIKKDDISFWIQIKRLSVLESENRQDKIFRNIKEQLNNIHIPLTVSILVSEKFNEQDISHLLAEIEPNASRDNIGRIFYWETNGEIKAEYEFFLPNKIKLCSLTLGITGDMESIDITGQDAGQIKGSLEKASIAINRNSDTTKINLIVMGADGKDNIDIAEACFGTELYHFRSGIEWQRNDDGFFNNVDYSNRITGVVALRRRESQPISSYDKTLFINPSFVEAIDNIRRIINIDHIIHFDDYVHEKK